MEDESVFKFITTIREWIASRPKLLPEVELKIHLHAKIASVLLKHSIPSEFHNQIVTDLESRALRTNLMRLLQEIKVMSKAKIKTFTRSKVIAVLQAMEPNESFKIVDEARTALLEMILVFTDRYLPTDSPSWGLFSVKRMLWGFEVVLINKLTKKLGEHYQWLDCVFAGSNEQFEIGPELLSGLSFEGFESLLLTKSEERKSQVMEEMNRQTQGRIPRTLMYKYECEIFFGFQDEAERVMKERFLPSIRRMMEEQMRVIASGDQKLFDSSLCSEELKALVFSAVCYEAEWLQHENESEVTRAFSLLFGKDAPEPMSESLFNAELDRLKPDTSLETKCAVSLSLLLLITGTFTKLCPDFTQHPDFAYSYSPVRRILFKRILRVFHIFIDISYLSNVAESVVSAQLTNDHPLSAHDPDYVLQTVARYGAEEYERKRMTDPLKRTFDKMHGFLKRIYSTNPATTHFSLTFYYQPIVTQPSLSLTIVIPGWMSLGVDMEEMWEQLREFSIPGRFTALAWDADSTVTAAISGGIADFHKACHKAKFTGRQLARQLSEHAFGMGPVSLIGFSLGSRVIFYTLEALKMMGGQKYVQDIVLLGGAAKNDPVIWNEFLSEVAGRAINVHSSEDLVLKHIYNIAMIGKPPPVGQGPIECERIENYDASSFVHGHSEHVTKLKKTLQRISYQA